MKLNLGVFDVPEWNGTPLHDVANILESKYGLFSKFAEDQHDVIANELALSVQGAITNLLVGGPSVDPFLEACSAIDARFQFFIDTSRVEALGIPGVPTGAALKGVNHRLKKARGARRPSFRDTGILRANFVSWVDE